MKSAVGKFLTSAWVGGVMLGLVPVLAQESDAAFSPMPEPTTFTIGKNCGTAAMPDGDTCTDNRMRRYIKDRLNIEVQHAWEVTSWDQYTQRQDLTIASGDLPDVMIVDGRQLQQLAEAELIQDLSAVYEEYASPFIKEAYGMTEGLALEQATLDGKLMGLPNVLKDGDYFPMLWLRQDWLENLGLEAPETLEEIKEVARAFKEDDPDGNGESDTVGLLASENWVFDFQPFFTYFGAFPGAWVDNAAGEVIYGSVTPEMKEALTLLQSWYQEGLIDPEFATLSGDTFEQKLVGGRAGMVVGPWWETCCPLINSVTNDPNAEWVPVFAPIPEDNVYRPISDSLTASFIVVRKDYAHPEAVMKTLNAQTDYSDPERPNYADHPEVVWTFVWPFSFILDRPDTLTYHQDLIEAAVERGDPEGLNPDDKAQYDDVVAYQADPVENRDKWLSYTNNMVSLPLLEDARIASVRRLYQADLILADARIWPTLEKQENETMLRILTGQLPVDGFDTFVQQWNRLGGGEILESVRSAAEATESAAQ
jgi:putative aldouronate transport system substrate-binding protein